MEEYTIAAELYYALKNTHNLLFETAEKTLHSKTITSNEYILEKYQYLNPNSPNYYKGFRYHKTKTGIERWYDENGNCSKEIGYYSNGNKNYECYYDQTLDYHNEEGYAYQYWEENGEISFQDYWLNGEELTEDEWKEEVSKIKESQLNKTI